MDEHEFNPDFVSYKVHKCKVLFSNFPFYRFKDPMIPKTQISKMTEKTDNDLNLNPTFC